MNLEPAPRLPKWIFLAIDLGLLVIAFLIISFAKNPYAPLPFITAVLCVALAAVIGLVPFLIDYAADSAEFVQRERERLAEQAARLQAGTESLARATSHIKAIEEAVHKSAREAETLPYRMQEKLAEFNEGLAAKEESDREALETELEQLRAANLDQLKGVADKIAKAAADWTALEIATRKQLTATEAALNKLQTQAADTAAKVDGAATAAVAKLETQLAASLQEIDARVAALKAAAAAIPTSVAVTALAAAPTPAPAAPAEPAVAAPPVPEPAPVAEIPSSPTESTPAPTAEIAVAAPVEETPSAEPAPTPVAEAPKPKKPRAPRKPKTEEAPAEASAATASEPAASPSEEPSPAEAPTAPVATAEPEPTPAPEPAPAPAPVAEPTPEPELVLASDEPAEETRSAGRAESSTSSDGATRLLATAYIGIGNKLFIRGDGPGLSWDRGVPMQFVSIGKWGWSTHDAAGPIHCKLYKNDELAAPLGEIVLEAGRHTEVTAMF